MNASGVRAGATRVEQLLSLLRVITAGASPMIGFFGHALRSHNCAMPPTCVKDHACSVLQVIEFLQQVVISYV